MNGVETLMNKLMMKKILIALSATLMLSNWADAGIIISEVYSAGSSSNGVYAADWFELTNTGAVAENITGWKVDDNSNSSASAVALRGITSIAPGQSVVFVEGDSTGAADAAVQAAFINFWFGGSAPGGFAIAGYGGSGVGLSTSGDALNIFNAANSHITGVAFGAATTGKTFDNAAGLGSTTLPLPVISTLSVNGVNGAFLSVGTPVELGSPGVVPEPGSALLLCLGAGSLAAARVVRKRRTHRAG